MTIEEEIIKKHIPHGCINLKSFKNENEKIIAIMTEYANHKLASRSFTSIAERIADVWDYYIAYEDTVRTINYHGALYYDNDDVVVELEQPVFENFEEETLQKMIDHWRDEKDRLEKEYHKLIYEVDTDDYK